MLTFLLVDLILLVVLILLVDWLNALTFSTLRELMYWAGRADLIVLYGLVSDKYKTKRATGSVADPERFYALPAIHVLETEAGDIMYMFMDRKYPLTPETIQQMLNHGLEINRDPSETKAGDIMYMFMDRKYPLTPETTQQMMNHGLEINRDPSGNDLTTDIQLIQSLLNQLNPTA
nr:hypothetical protein [Tanacetum cinerariifolium]GFB80159.1 hypothetical protein [Tanacetum cinerariifolium]